jgi:hypothetical protein
VGDDYPDLTTIVGTVKNWACIVSVWTKSDEGRDQNEQLWAEGMRFRVGGSEVRRKRLG